MFDQTYLIMKRNLFLASLALSIVAFSCNQPSESGQESTEKETVEEPAVTMTEEEELIEAAKASPDELKAQYNLAVYYYNQALEGIENLSFVDSNDASQEAFEKAYAQQEAVQVLFNQALPHAKKCYKLDSTHTNTIVMLGGIYFGLNDLEKSSHFQDILNDSTRSNYWEYQSL